MPLHVGKKVFPHLSDLIEHVKRAQPEVSDPAAYAASVARKVEPGFDKEAAKAKKEKRS